MRSWIAAVLICAFPHPAAAAIGKAPPSDHDNRTIHPSPTPLDIRTYEAPDRDFTVYCSLSEKCSLSEFFKQTHVCALFVIKDRRIRIEWYSKETFPKGSLCEGKNLRGRRYGVASVTKSLTSTMLGQVLAQRFGARTAAQYEVLLNRQIGSFLTGDERRSLADGYATVRLGQALQMQSGIEWREEAWPRWISDNVLFDETVRSARSESVLEFAAHYRRTRAKDPKWHYSALDAAMAAAIAGHLADQKPVYSFADNIWSMAGTKQSAKWGVDRNEVPIGACCFTATVDDLARFGDFVLRKGDGKMPAAWFDLATGLGTAVAIDDDRRDEPFGKSCVLRYGYFWWLRKDRRDFTAFGRDGQFVHIYPQTNTVIVQIADWGDHRDSAEWRCVSLRTHDAIVHGLSQ